MTVRRTKIVEQLAAEGYSVTERTMRYWESRGWLPKPFRGDGGYATYRETPIDTARMLAATRPRNISALRNRVTVHDYPDKVVTVEVKGEDIFVRINTRKD